MTQDLKRAPHFDWRDGATNLRALIKAIEDEDITAKRGMKPATLVAKCRDAWACEEEVFMRQFSNYETRKTLHDVKDKLDDYETV